MEASVHFQRLRQVSIVCILLFFSAQPLLADESAIVIQAAASGALYVPAVLDAQAESDMLIDTGSSYVALSADTFDRISEKTRSNFSRYIYAAMANGKVERVSLYILDSLQLSANCILNNVEIALLPDADKDILGLNALSLLQPFTISLAPATLSTQSCST